MKTLAALVGTAFLVAGCASYSTVSEKRPMFQPNAGAVCPLVNAEAGIVKWMQLERGNSLAAVGEYLSAAEAASLQLKRNPSDKIAQRDYNFALSRVFAAIRDGRLDPWTHPLRAPAPGGGEFTLTHKRDPRPNWNPALYEFTHVRS